MPKTTPFHAYHERNSRLTEFAGYEMPLWYTTISDEHMAVRNSSGVFDVSHMGRFLIEGKDAGRFLESLVPTQVQTQPDCKSFYTLLLNDQAGIIDDTIVSKLSDSEYLAVVNAANTSVDMDHLKRASGGFELEIKDVTGSSALIAVQGPLAAGLLQPILSLDLNTLKRFHCSYAAIMGERCLVSRTGYTGEDGFEVMVEGVSGDDPAKAVAVWERLAGASTPCGLGARDSLRLEAGLPLHGSDIDQKTDPFQAGLGWVISPGKGGYVGAEAVSELKQKGTTQIRRGLVLETGIPRSGYEVLDATGDMIGVVTSGTFSPVLRRGIALSRVRVDKSELGSPVQVRVRTSTEGGKLVKTPFYDENAYGWKRQE